MLIKGEENILWKGKPLYFAKTSGTTSEQNPFYKESMPYHIEALEMPFYCTYMKQVKADLWTEKMIFLQGSPAPGRKESIWWIVRNCSF
jgi:hypothetical protein